MAPWFHRCRIWLVLPATGGMGLAGCRAGRSVLAPSSAEAGAIAQTLWIFFAACVTVYVVVMLVALATVAKHRASTRPTIPPHGIPEPSAEKRTWRLIGGATATTALILVGLLVVDLLGQRREDQRDEHPVVIRITGRQWWWAVEYQNSDPSQVFESANEIHVPVGRSVQLLLESADVIHSFWVPRLQGKKDLVPGHPTSLWFRADRPGQFTGQCAEFCGLQHAHMGLLVVAEEPAKFDAWSQAQRAEAPPPVTDSQRHGRAILESMTCAMCHTVAGTTARSRAGPVLTHFASRQTLGAGSAANTRERLAEWIANPHDLKPGVLMPAHTFPPADLAALLDYLETLK